MTKKNNHNKTAGTYVPYNNKSKTITSILRHISSYLRIPSSVWFEVSNMRYIYVVLVIIICLTGFLHASTPEFKRGGVYLSGDVILGKYEIIKGILLELIALIITHFT